MVDIVSYVILLFDLFSFSDSILFIAIVVFDDWELVTVLYFSLTYLFFFFFLVIISVLLWKLYFQAIEVNFDIVLLELDDGLPAAMLGWLWLACALSDDLFKYVSWFDD